RGGGEDGGGELLGRRDGELGGRRAELDRLDAGEVRPVDRDLRRDGAGSGAERGDLRGGGPRTRREDGQGQQRAHGDGRDAGAHLKRHGGSSLEPSCPASPGFNASEGMPRWAGDRGRVQEEGTDGRPTAPSCTAKPGRSGRALDKGTLKRM